MKTCSMILILLVVSVSAASQGTVTRKAGTFSYFNRTEAGFSFGVGSFKTDIRNGIQRTIRNDEIVISFQTINGIAYHNRIGIGAGIGIEKWQHGLFFPVFGQLFYDVRPKDNTFFGQASLGTAIGSRDSTAFYHQGDGGLMFQLGIGYKMKVFKRLRFYYEIFYKYQSVFSTYGNTVTTDSTSVTREFDYKVPLHFAGFRIGISFY